MTLFGLVRSVNPITVNRTGLEIGNVAVKDFVGIFGKIDPLALDFAFVIEQAKFDAGRIRRKQREVDTLSVPPGAAWKWAASRMSAFRRSFINCGLAAIAPIVQ